jgi:serine/threonine-protein kinase
MQELGIHIGQDVPGEFPVIGGTKPVPVKESTTFTLVDELGELRPGTVLSGRLIFGEDRVYGRFTHARQAESKGGQTYPVCFELRSRAGKLGVEIMRNSGPDSVVVSSAQFVKAVDRFE